jgi:hypothetical protein
VDDPNASGGKGVPPAKERLKSSPMKNAPNLLSESGGAFLFGLESAGVFRRAVCAGGVPVVEFCVSHHGRVVLDGVPLLAFVGAQ